MPTHHLYMLHACTYMTYCCIYDCGMHTYHVYRVSRHACAHVLIMDTSMYIAMHAHIYTYTYAPHIGFLRETKLRGDDLGYM